MTTKPLRVLSYSRCSTSHHDQNPEVQRDELRRYCGARGWEIVEEIIDHGFSGGSRDRPGLKRLITLARSRKIDGIVVLNLSRLFRSLKDLVTTLDEFQTLGLTFVSVKEQVDYSTAAGKLFVGVIGALDSFTRDLIRENTLLGLDHARRKGKRLGRPVVHDADQIRALRAEGMSYRQIQSKTGAPMGTITTALKGAQKSPSKTGLP